MQQQYNCFIVDDDEIDRLTALSYVRKYSFLKVTGVFENAADALVAAQTNPPHVMLLDIDMPNITGIELRRHLQSIPACIFITSYADYALDSFEVSALDFMVKPIKSDRFAAAMERLRTYLDLYHKADLYDHSIGGDAVFIKMGHEQIKLNLQDIIYLEALKDYTGIITQQKKYCVLSPLGNLLKEKSFRAFVRIHRSYAVQRHLIERVTTQEVFINNYTLPIGRSYKAELDLLFQ